MRLADNKELKLLDSASREFARKELAAGREENDHYPYGPFFDRILQQAFELDFFHIMLPESQGGVGHDLAALCLILDNICREDSSLGGIIFTNTASQEIMLAAGGEDMLAEITAAPETVGNFLIACPVLFNPLESPLTLTAVKKGDNFSLSGTMDYVVLAGLADQALVPAAVEGQDNMAYFLVEMNAAGLSQSGPVVSHGLHACPAEDLELRDVPGRPVGLDQGDKDWLRQAFYRLQLIAAAMAGGVMKGSFQEALKYCRERSQGGRKIKDWSEIQMLLSNMAIQVQVADMLVEDACRSVTGAEDGWVDKLQATALHILSVAPQVVTDGIQALGGVGYMKDFGQEKRFRDIGHIQAFLGYFPMKKIRYARRLI
ncbi:MAG: acyl-CoA dehydrogenase family protein [Desulfosudaceae bacterium]